MEISSRITEGTVDFDLSLFCFLSIYQPNIFRSCCAALTKIILLGFNLRSRIGWFSGGIGKENCANQNDEISLYDPILDVIFHFLLYLLYMFSLVFFLLLPFYNLMQGPSICKDVVFICL